MTKKVMKSMFDQKQMKKFMDEMKEGIDKDDLTESIKDLPKEKIEMREIKKMMKQMKKATKQYKKMD